MAKTFVSFVFASVPLLAAAQTYEDVGTRARGMGGAFVAVADDASASWWNPAGLASGAYFSAVFDLGQADDGARARGISLGIPALALSYYRLRLSQIESAGSTGGTPPGRQDNRPASSPFSLDISQYGATFGQSLGRHLVVASTLKLVRARSATEGDLDLGAMAVFGPLKVGASARNIRKPAFGEGADRVQLARRARAGSSLTVPAHGRLDQLTLAFDADLIRIGDTRRIAGGAEAWLFSRLLGLRGGLNDRGRAAGLSIALRPGIYAEGSVSGGSDQARRGWGVDLRVTF